MTPARGRCRMPLWADDARPDRRFCAEPVADARSRGLAANWCPACLALVKRDPIRATAQAEAEAERKARPKRAASPAPAPAPAAPPAPPPAPPPARAPKPATGRPRQRLDVAQAIALRGEGLTVPQIAARLDVARSTVLGAFATAGIATGRWLDRASPTAGDPVAR